MSEWIEKELSRQLGQAKAPDTLWPRVASARPARRGRDVRWVLWPAFAALMLLASSEIRYHAQRPTFDRNPLPLNSLRTAAARTGREVCAQCHTERL